MTAYMITHTDLDGIGASILLENILKPVDFVRYCVNPNDINKTVEKVLSEATNSDYLYVTDLAPDNQTLLPLIDNKFADWKIYDHHSSRSIKNSIYDKHVISSGDADLSATALVWNDLKSSVTDAKFKSHIELIVRYINDYDTWKWQLDKNYPKFDFNRVNMINLLFWFTPKNKRDNFVKNLFNNIHFFSDKTRNVIFEILKTNQNEYIESKFKHSKQLVFDFYGHSVLTQVVTAEQNISELGNALLSKFDVPIAIIISNKNVALRGNSKYKDINVGKIAKDYFDGGGHELSAGGTLINTNHDVKQVLLSYFN